jgi:NAD(P)-dependent dehydrogenase (short-subunit alcohol dehydrogenase family)
VALVTGAARGIGLETARSLHQRGASVAVVDLEKGPTEAAATSIGERTLAIAGDVSDESAIAGAVDAVVTEFGGLDIVVANAGIAGPIRSVAASAPEAFDAVLSVNLNGVVHTVRQALPHVIERRGHVLVISSVYAFLNGGMQTSSAMSKAAVEPLGRALRVELAGHGASAGVGYFGFVDTAMVAGARRDPIAGRLEGLAPRPFRKQISPRQAGEALVGGIEKRAARTIRPRIWAPYSRLRGLVNPWLDARVAKDDVVRSAIREGEQAEADRLG